MGKLTFIASQEISMFAKPTPPTIAKLSARTHAGMSTQNSAESSVNASRRRRFSEPARDSGIGSQSLSPRPSASAFRRRRLSVAAHESGIESKSLSPSTNSFRRRRLSVAAQQRPAGSTITKRLRKLSNNTLTTAPQRWRKSINQVVCVLRVKSASQGPRTFSLRTDWRYWLVEPTLPSTFISMSSFDRFRGLPCGQTPSFALERPLPSPKTPMLPHRYGVQFAVDPQRRKPHHLPALSKPTPDTTMTTSMRSLKAHRLSGTILHDSAVLPGVVYT